MCTQSKVSTEWVWLLQHFRVKQKIVNGAIMSWGPSVFIYLPFVCHPDETVSFMRSGPLFGSLLYFPGLEECLAHSRWFMNVG